MQMENNQEVLLRVEHLCQFFGSTKAVNDVSFDIKKGEVFGLVGESGCGKTTTGRSIIKLYDITSGNIYFKGIRIGAGTLSYRLAIKEARKNYKEKVKGADAATAKALEGHLLVTLSASQPHLANEDILHGGDTFLADAEGEALWSKGSFGGGEDEEPTAIGTNLSGGFGLGAPGGGH